MKYLLIGLLFLASCTRYDQTIAKYENSEGYVLVTYVNNWGDVIKVWHDDINDVTDSLVELRKRQADSLVKAVKKMK